MSALAGAIASDAPAALKPGRLPGIEALRGIAALCVVLLHVQATFGGHPAVFGKGYLAVDFFLMLSGFLMTRTQEWRFAGPAAGWLFLRARIGRLWPMMALGGLLGAPVLYLRSDDSWHFLSLALPNLLLLPASFDNLVYPLNIPAWTIFYELLANALHVAIFRRFGWGTLVLAIAVSLAIMIAVALHFGSFDVGARPQHFAAGLPRILLAYLIGMALGRWWAGPPPIAVPPFAALAAMPVLFIASWALGWTGWPFDLLFVTIACPLIIAGGLRLEARARAAYWSGMLSFPLFAVHMPILQAAYELRLGYLAGGLAAIAGGIALALATNWPRRRAARYGRIPA